VINIPQLIHTASPATYLLGLFCAFLALVAWSWYAVANARFLKRNPHLLSSDWATLVGVGTLFWVTLLTSILALFFTDHLQLETSSLKSFLIGSTVLGVLCSWLGTFLWDKRTKSSVDY